MTLIPASVHSDTTDLDKLIAESCGCQKLAQGPCIQAFTREELKEMHLEARALDYRDDNHTNRLDLVVLSALRVCK
jgi:hypothetical protein